MKRIAVMLIAGVAVVSVLLALAVVFGAPQPPPPMESINAPFRSVDFSDLAQLKRYTARDRARLAFRAYAPAASPAKGSAVLIHGSSASSTSLHLLAKGLAQAGYAVYALATNFRPHDDYRADIRAAKQPLYVLVGQDDEIFYADQFSTVFEEAGRPVPVTLLPGVGHVDITLQPAAIQATAETLDSLRKKIPEQTGRPSSRR